MKTPSARVTTSGSMATSDHPRRRWKQRLLAMASWLTDRILAARERRKTVVLPLLNNTRGRLLSSWVERKHNTTAQTEAGPWVAEHRGPLSSPLPTPVCKGELGAQRLAAGSRLCEISTGEQRVQHFF